MAGAWSRLRRTIRSFAARSGRNGYRDASADLWIVHGVVGPEGVCGERIAHAGGWTLRFSLSPWHIGGGLAMDEKLHLWRRCSGGELAAFQRALPPGTAISARVRPEPVATFSAELLELVEPRVFTG